MLTAIACDEEETLTVASKSHTAHPDTAFAPTTILIPDIGLRSQGTRFCCKLSYYFLLIHVDTDYKACVVEEITG